jgi:16S rRNA C1402 N4-methylase RsmH
MAKGTRITVDLGNEELLKAVKIAAVERGKSLREIVIEALQQWLERKKIPADKDFQAMMQVVNEYRRTTG